MFSDFFFLTKFPIVLNGLECALKKKKNPATVLRILDWVLGFIFDYVLATNFLYNSKQTT